MRKISIVIIILCSALIAAVAFFTLQEKPGINEIYLADSSNTDKLSMADRGDTRFPGQGSSIYVIIPVNSVKSGDVLDVEWTFIAEKNSEIIQNDEIIIEDDGTGSISVYLLKRDSSYRPGDYKVKAVYNGLEEREAFFTITGTQAPNL